MTLLALCVAMMGSCGDDGPDKDGSSPNGGDAHAVDLSIRADDGAGTVKEARLECSGTKTDVRGLPGRDPAELCGLARQLAAFFARKPEAGRACTQIYGGPEAASVRGTIGGREVERRFSRRNGCEIADWERVAPLLPLEAEGGSGTSPG
jgi:hypothetical protein